MSKTANLTISEPLKCHFGEILQFSKALKVLISKSSEAIKMTVFQIVNSLIFFHVKCEWQKNISFSHCSHVTIWQIITDTQCQKFGFVHLTMLQKISKCEVKA